MIFLPDRYALTADSQDVRKSFLAAWKTLNREAPHFGATSHGDSERWWSDLVHGTMKGCKKIIDCLKQQPLLIVFLVFTCSRKAVRS